MSAMALGAALSPALVTSIWISAHISQSTEEAAEAQREESCSAPHSMAVTVPELTPWPPPCHWQRGHAPSSASCTPSELRKREDQNALLMAGYRQDLGQQSRGAAPVIVPILRRRKQRLREVNSGMGPAPRLGCLRDWISASLFCPVPPALLTPTSRGSPGPCASHAVVGGEALVASGTGWLGEGPRVATATANLRPAPQGLGREAHASHEGHPHPESDGRESQQD